MTNSEKLINLEKFINYLEREKEAITKNYEKTINKAKRQAIKLRKEIKSEEK